jgi:hypothetical protein
MVLNEEQPSLAMSADLSKASAVECILSRRDSMIVESLTVSAKLLGLSHL